MCKTIKTLLIAFSCMRVSQAFAEEVSSAMMLASKATHVGLNIAEIGGFDLVIGIFVVLMGLVAIIVLAGNNKNSRHWKGVGPKSRGLPSGGNLWKVTSHVR